MGVDGTRGALFALRVYVGVTETFAGVQSTANSYTSLWRSDTPATTSGAKRPRRSGLYLRLLRPLAATCRYGLAASWGCRYNLCSASFWPHFAASPHPPIFVSFGDVGAAKLDAAACSLHRMLARLRTAPLLA